MVTLKIKPWEPINGLTHKSTSWQIATDNTFSNIVDKLDASSTWLEIYYSPITIPPNMTYYARSQRTLSDNTVLPWTDPIPVRADDISTAILLHQEVLIEKPVVSIDESTLDSSSTTLTIKSSRGRFTGDGHYSTNWVIKDHNDNTLYSSLYDTDNLLTLTIDKTDIDFKDNSVLNIYVTHNTATGVSSSCGYYLLDNNKFNFNIDTNLINVDPYVDLVIPLTKVDLSNIIGIREINLKNKYNDEVIYNKKYSVDIDNITIPKELLLPDKEYVLELVIVDYYNDGKMYIYIKTNTHSTRSLYQDINVKYQNIATSAGDNSNLNIPSYMSTYETFDYVIPMIDSDIGTDIYVFKYDRSNKNLYNTKDKITGASVFSNTDGIYTRILEGNILLVDSVSNGKATFAVFDYNPIEHRAVLKYSKSRDNETLPIGYGNSIVQVDIDTIYYLPTLSASTLVKYDINTNTLTNTAPFPTTPLDYSTIVDIGEGKILLLGKGETKSYIYNITTDDWEEGIAIPSAFRDKKLKAVKLLNGNSIIYRTFKDDTFTDDDILLYDHLKMEFKVVNTNTTNSKSPDTNIPLNDGSILLLEHTDNGGVTKQQYK